MWSAWECVSSVSQVLQLQKCSYCTCDGFRKGRTLRDKVILFFLFFISSGCQLPKFVISVVKKRKEKKNIRAYCFIWLWSGGKPWKVGETCRGFTVPDEDLAACEDKVWQEGLGLWV